VCLLLWCVRDFYLAGKGTLAPWDPPRHLVVVGLYRVSRNPTYLAVSLVLIGWAIGYRSGTLAAYALAVMVAFPLRVAFWEEPWLARTHQEQWTRYTAPKQTDWRRRTSSFRRHTSSSQSRTPYFSASRSSLTTSSSR